MRCGVASPRQTWTVRPGSPGRTRNFSAPWLRCPNQTRRSPRPAMETIGNGRRREGAKGIGLDLRTGEGGVFFTQEDLLEERMLTHDGEEAVRRRDRKRELLRFGLMHGAKIEPGPLKAQLRYRLNRRRMSRRQRQDESYAVLSVHV